LDAAGEELVVGLVFELGCRGGVEGLGAKLLEELAAAVGGAAEVEDHHAAGSEDEGFYFVGFAETAGAEGLEGGDEDLLREVFGGVVVAEMAEAVAADARSHLAAELGFGFRGRWGSEAGGLGRYVHGEDFIWNGFLFL
jgi:hypothetical protein